MLYQLAILGLLILVLIAFIVFQKQKLLTWRNLWVLYSVCILFIKRKNNVMYLLNVFVILMLYVMQLQMQKLARSKKFVPMMIVLVICVAVCVQYGLVQMGVLIALACVVFPTHSSIYLTILTFTMVGWGGMHIQSQKCFHNIGGLDFSIRHSKHSAFVDYVQFYPYDASRDHCQGYDRGSVLQFGAIGFRFVPSLPGDSNQLLVADKTMWLLQGGVPLLPITIYFKVTQNFADQVV